MSFLRRFRESSEERAERQRREAAEGVQRERDEAERRASAERERQAAEQAAHQARMREILGDDLADMEVNSPEEAKVAIKLAKLRKREIQGQKRELASELADVREQWRQRQAGRISTVGMGRGTSARFIRAGIQSKRRGERLDHAKEVNAFSDAKQELDYMITVIDGLIIDLEREALG